MTHVPTNTNSPARSIPLINPERLGTIIIGEFRLGSHFLQSIIAEHANQQGLEINCKGEYSFKLSVDELTKEIRDLNNDNRYHTIILNHMRTKETMLLNPYMVHNWHVIRVQPDDRIRWFFSWFFHNYLPHQLTREEILEVARPRETTLDGTKVYYFDDHHRHFFEPDKLKYWISWHESRGHFTVPEKLGKGLLDYHHGTSTKIFKRMLSIARQKTLPWQFWVDLSDCMTNHVLGSRIPADVEIPYTALHSLETESTRWTPNHYPKIDIDREFRDGKILKSFLERWLNPLPGKFKDES